MCVLTVGGLGIGTKWGPSTSAVGLAYLIKG